MVNGHRVEMQACLFLFFMYFLFYLFGFLLFLFFVVTFLVKERSNFIFRGNMDLHSKIVHFIRCNFGMILHT